MHRTFVGDLQQALALFVGELAFQRDGALDAVARTPSTVDLFVAEATLTRVSGIPAFGVHAQRHRGTGAQPGHHEIERGRAGIAPPMLAGSSAIS
jgi:hypothetical protein